MAGVNAELRRQEAVKLRQEQIRKAQKKAQVEGLKNMGKDAVMQEAVKAGAKQIGSMFSGAGAGAAQGSGASSLASYGSYLGPQSGAGAASGGMAGMMPYLGPAAVAALVLPGIIDFAKGRTPLKYKEGMRLQKLAEKGMDLSNAPEYKKDLKDGEYTGSDLMGRAELYDLFGDKADQAAVEKFANEAVKAKMFDLNKGSVFSQASRDAQKMQGMRFANMGMEGYSPDRSLKEEAVKKLAAMQALAGQYGLNIRDEYKDRLLAAEPEKGSFFSKPKRDAQLEMMYDLYSRPTSVAPEVKKEEPSVQKPGFLGTPSVGPESAIDLRNMRGLGLVDTNMQLKPQDAAEWRQLMGGKKNIGL